jgi:hypothetical protein
MVSLKLWNESNWGRSPDSPQQEYTKYLSLDSAESILCRARTLTVIKNGEFASYWRNERRRSDKLYRNSMHGGVDQRIKDRYLTTNDLELFERQNLPEIETRLPKWVNDRYLILN